MITKAQAQNALRAYEQETRLGGYIEEQFDLMQRKPLDFIIKWEALAAQIVTRYVARFPND